MEPIVKWYGGLEKQRDVLLQLLPNHFENYYEPFLGGGTMYFAMAGKTCYVNDKCKELMSLYKMMDHREGSAAFTNYFGTMAAAWKKIEAHFLGVVEELEELNERYRLGLYHDYHDFVSTVNKTVDRITYRDIFYRAIPDPTDFRMELRHCVVYEMLRMEKLTDLDDKDIRRNLLFSMRQAIYGFLMDAVNRESADEAIRAAALAFILNYCSSEAPFKRDEWGQIRLPFGPREKANVSLAPQVKQLKSAEFEAHLDRTSFCCDDALVFLQRNKPKADDFIFLDPPDEVRKEAGEMDYSPIQHKRLADYLIGKCPAQWMLLVQPNCSALPQYRKANMRISRMEETEKLIVRNY